MFVQIEETPNPNTIKFLLGQELLGANASPLAFSSAQEAATSSPFADRLFGIEGVAGVLLGSDFVSITKKEDEDWLHLKPFLFHTIVECLTRGVPALGEVSPSCSASVNAEQAENDQLIASYEDPGTRGVVSRIIDVLDKYVRPAVAQDGGHVRFRRYENGVVYIAMQGACQGCPSSHMTLKGGIERTLKFYVPEIFSVEAEKAPA